MKKIVILAAIVCATATDALAQQGAERGEWRVFGADAGATRFSPLDQIHAGNVAELEVAWRWSARNYGSPPPSQRMQISPLMIDGVLYTTVGNQRDVAAIDAATGETMWTWRPGEAERRWGDIIEPLTRSAGRGVSYWTDGAGDERIFVVTPTYQLVALDARTGYQVAGFGEGGVVDMMDDLRWDERPGSVREGRVSNSSPPAILGNVVVPSVSMHTGSIPTRSSPNEVWPMNIPGDVVAYDARTGRRLWRFNTVPSDGELGVDTWLPADPSMWDVPVGTHPWVQERPELLEASWRYTGNVGHWAPVTADEELGLFYVPTETPTNDYFGGYRPGSNLFGNSVLALDAETGERVWHYQLTHHELWDYDLPAAPILVDIEVDGIPIKALVQLSKQGFAYVLDRETGEPVWPILERPVAPSDVPGERASPTQPFPTKPPPFESQGISEDDVIDFTPALRAEALQVLESYRIGPLYTPPSLVGPGNNGTLSRPGAAGGANWPGGAVDSEEGILFVPSRSLVSRFGLVEGTERTGVRYHVAESRAAPTLRGLPILKPPYGRISAIDLKTGEMLWQVPHGETPDYIRDHPDLRGVDVGQTGRPTIGSGLLVTSTLLFSGDGPGGAPVLRAYDKATGDVLHEVPLPGGATIGFPITYEVDGRQYIVVAAVDEESVSELVAFALR
ncbi:MAG: PQQ-binding-like beta-propeller repeat protein [Gemmatimonadota bacterium]|nr:PQQ-binding-like beta-propeller repeat protein [Gemmatimonadota bacterium]